MPDAAVSIAIRDESFATSGLVISDRGYLEIFPYDRWSDKQLPTMRENQTFMPTGILLKESETRPPSLLSESELISLMDREGIGTDATIAEHIATIQKRHYAEKTPDRLFVPTTLGMALVQGYNSLDIPLGKPYLRAQMERDCTAICRGQKIPDQVTEECLQAMKQVYRKVIANGQALERELARYFRPGVRKLWSSVWCGLHCRPLSR